MRSNPNVRSFVQLTIELHSCIEEPEHLAMELERLLRDKLDSDFDSDIEVYISETT
jgi:hypothetical protein